MQVRAQLRKMLTDALFWAVVVVIMLATIGAVVIRSLFNRTLANISATVDILTGHKTVLEYLLKPILKARETALTER